MLTIWKFPLKVADEQIIEMPANARILTVQTQQGKPYLWVLVDSDHPKEPRTILVYGTWHPIDLVPSNYIGTFQVELMFGGSLVFHVFERI